MPTGTRTRGRLAQPVPDGRERRRRGQGAPVHHPELAHLDLSALRTYRQELQDEETRVSYWRRVVQARLEALAGAVTEEAGELLDSGDEVLRRLHEVVSEPRTAARRGQLLAVVTADATAVAELSALGCVAELCDREISQDGLERAEQQLSTLRQLLDDRLDAATQELVSRYSQSPSDCLVALPVDPRGGLLA